MGRAAPGKTSNLSEEPEVPLSLDHRLALLLEEIEAEKTPDRLLKLAEELQRELALRKQRKEPN